VAGQPKQLPTGFASLRDGILFLAGLALGARAVLTEPLCETCLLVAVGLCVAPAALLPGRLAGDERREEPPA
jgi:hypothetical protein